MRWETCQSLEAVHYMLQSLMISAFPETDYEFGILGHKSRSFKRKIGKKEERYEVGKVCWAMFGSKLFVTLVFLTFQIINFEKTQQTSKRMQSKKISDLLCSILHFSLECH